MPTGYTADIAKDISFETYALRCARAFGALVMMRDDPMDAPVPDKQDRSDYHVKALDAANKRIEELKGFSAADKEIAAQLVFDEATKNYHERVRESNELEAKYRAMLEKVDSYVAPTADHVGYKEFMRSQILESIKFDCGTEYLMLPVLQTPDEWYAAELSKMAHDIEYHTKQQKEDDARNDSRDKWVSELKASLNIK